MKFLQNNAERRKLKNEIHDEQQTELCFQWKATCQTQLQAVRCVHLSPKSTASIAGFLIHLWEVTGRL